MSIDANIGRVVGGTFQLVRLIGRGGAASVYQGLDLQIDRAVAIKLSHSRATPSVLARLRAESKRLMLLRHPSAVRSYEWGCDQEGRIFAVSELLSGCTLAAMLHGGRALSLDEALPVIEQIASALGAAHRAQLIHGDLKPSNVLLDGGSKVSFGLSRLLIDPATGASPSDPRRVLYKPIYGSPEQLLRNTVDARTDVYSLGALAYHCLAGRPPFSGTFEELRASHAWEPPDPLDPQLIPREIGALVLRMLEKDPADRPAIRQICERVGDWSDRAVTALVNMPVRLVSISEQR